MAEASEPAETGSPTRRAAEAQDKSPLKRQSRWDNLPSSERRRKPDNSATAIVARNTIKRCQGTRTNRNRQSDIIAKQRTEAPVSLMETGASLWKRPQQITSAHAAVHARDDYRALIEARHPACQFRTQKQLTPGDPPTTSWPRSQSTSGNMTSTGPQNEPSWWTRPPRGASLRSPSALGRNQTSRGETFKWSSSRNPSCSRKNRNPRDGGSTHQQQEVLAAPTRSGTPTPTATATPTPTPTATPTPTPTATATPTPTPTPTPTATATATAPRHPSRRQQPLPHPPEEKHHPDRSVEPCETTTPAGCASRRASRASDYLRIRRTRTVVTGPGEDSRLRDRRHGFLQRRVRPIPDLPGIYCRRGQSA